MLIGFQFGIQSNTIHELFERQSTFKNWRTQNESYLGILRKISAFIRDQSQELLFKSTSQKARRLIGKEDGIPTGNRSVLKSCPDSGVRNVSD
jgi:hypothetical protein